MIYATNISEHIKTYKSSKIESVYKAAVEYIEWFTTIREAS